MDGSGQHEEETIQGVPELTLVRSLAPKLALLRAVAEEGNLTKSRRPPWACHSRPRVGGWWPCPPSWARRWWCPMGAASGSPAPAPASPRRRAGPCPSWPPPGCARRPARPIPSAAMWCWRSCTRSASNGCPSCCGPFGDSTRSCGSPCCRAPTWTCSTTFAAGVPTWGSPRRCRGRATRRGALGGAAVGRHRAGGAPLAGRAWVRMAELSGEAFVRIRAGSGLREEVDELAEAAGFTPTRGLSRARRCTRCAAWSPPGLGWPYCPSQNRAAPGVVEDSVAPQGNPPHRPDLAQRPPYDSGRAGLPRFRTVQP